MKNAIERTLLQAGLWSATGRTFPQAGPGKVADDLSRQALYTRTFEERMGPMLAAFATDHAPQLRDDLRGLVACTRLASDIYYRHLGSIVESLARRGVRCLLLKGGALDLEVYREEIPRSMVDLDLLVKPVDVDATREVFAETGFVQGILNQETMAIEPLPPEKQASIEEDHYELFPFLKLVAAPELASYRAVLEQNPDFLKYGMVVGDEVYLSVAFDVHFGLARTIDVADAWVDPLTLTLPGGQETLAQSFTDMLWFLATRMYHEIMAHDKRSMRMFIDVVAIVERFGDRIDWQRVLAMAEKYHLQPSLYYCFWHVDELLGRSVPESVLAELEPSREPINRSHDWGDFVPKMLGFSAAAPIATG